jgi:hypothetical protein
VQLLYTIYIYAYVEFLTTKLGMYLGRPAIALSTLLKQKYNALLHCIVDSGLHMCRVRRLFSHKGLKLLIDGRVIVTYICSMNNGVNQRQKVQNLESYIYALDDHQKTTLKMS